MKQPKREPEIRGDPAKPLTEWTPAEIDTELARLDRRRFDTWMNLKRAQDSQARAEERVAKSDAPHLKQYLAEALEAVARIQVTLQKIAKEAAPYNDEFARRGGWTRYYLVQAGHVHRETSCSTCRWNTRFGWLPHLSACDENVMVEEYGDLACAVCFPAVLNHPEYLRTAKLRAAEEKAKLASQCPGSGRYTDTSRFRWTKCSVCGRNVPVTQRGKLRQHAKL